MNIEILGYLAGTLCTVSLLPQVIKSYRTKSTKDISIVYTLILAIGLGLWIIYGTINTIIPLTIFATVEFFLTVNLIVLKLIYK